MPHVSVTIAGRAYRMACDEGQENHLLGLGRQLDSRIDQLRGSFGEIGDMRLAVMAGIMIADELVEAQRNIAALRSEVQHLLNVSAGTAQEKDEMRARVTLAVDTAAERIERLAATLAGSGV